MLQVDFNILNQKGTPAFLADAFANRPPAGFVGRIFVDTNNPSTGMYRDTGTIWVNVASVGTAGSQNLQSVCNLGNTTTTNMYVGNAPTLGNYQILDVEGSSTYTTYGNSPLTAINANKSQIFNAGSVFINGPAHTTITGSANLGLDASISLPNGLSAFGSGYFTSAYALRGFTINVGQAGSGRSVSELRTQTTILAGAGIITHSSGIYIGQCYQPVGPAATINNRYALFIQDQSEVFVGVLGLRYGIYQAGGNDSNWFAGATSIGSNTFVTGYKVNIDQGGLRVQSTGSTSATNGLLVTNGGGTTGLVVRDDGNVGIRTASPTARMHIATGGASTASLGLKVRNSADTIDVLSTFGTTQVIINSNSASLSPSAQLQIDSTTRGVLLPRMTDAQIFAIVSPADGLMVYSTTQNHIAYFDGSTSTWKKVNNSNL